MEFDLTSGELGGALLPSQLPSLLPQKPFLPQHGFAPAGSHSASMPEIVRGAPGPHWPSRSVRIGAF